MRQGLSGSAVIRYRVTGSLLLLAHLLLVAWVSLRPLDDVLWVTAPNFQPLAGIRADLALGPVEAARRIGEGLALLAPLGVLLPMAGGRLRVSPFVSLVRTVAAGALLSLGIELWQTGVPGQVVDVDSLLLNTAGVALAHLVVVPLTRARLRRRWEAARTRVGGATPSEEEAGQGSTPRISRVGVAR
ncbi:VanZ family protein [Streptomyces sp. NPDC054863]